MTTSNAKPAYEGPRHQADRGGRQHDGRQGYVLHPERRAAMTGRPISIAPPRTGASGRTRSLLVGGLLRATWKPANTATFTVTRDVTPPTTTVRLLTDTRTSAGRCSRLAAGDGIGTGVAGPGTGWTRAPGRRPRRPGGRAVVWHGHPHVSWYSRDNAGNQEAAQSVSFSITAGASPAAPVLTPV